MATVHEERVPAWFWVVAVLAVLWEAMGCYAYMSQVTMSASQIAALPQAQQDLMAHVPIWATAAFAIATWGGLLGAIGLLLRRSWARTLFMASLAAVLVQWTWWLLIARAADVMGLSAYVMPVCVIVIGALLVWFSGFAARRGLLR
ncbi:hypothetical protein ACFSCW_12285 [Sphingomonas tabacisoli]|uniref:Sugar transporter n=1 Tax=Sphingomonas tabacisoli TaxID=2249466 RepID=A0ABW4I4M3_9SPHN